MLKLFRVISVLEGLSYLTILSVSLGFISRDYVSAIGMGHGVLFLLYIVFSLVVSSKLSWRLLTWLAVFLASIIPFAFIALELYLSRQEAKQQTA